MCINASRDIADDERPRCFRTLRNTVPSKLTDELVVFVGRRWRHVAEMLCLVGSGATDPKGGAALEDKVVTIFARPIQVWDGMSLPRKPNTGNLFCVPEIRAGFMRTRTALHAHYRRWLPFPFFFLARALFFCSFRELH